MRIKNVTTQAVWAKILGFGNDEKGAITVEWVVITAAVVTLGMGVTRCSRSTLKILLPMS